MATLTAADLNARQVMVALGYHLVGRADHPVALAEEMRDFFAAVAREHRSSRVEPLRKRPSGAFAAVAAELEKGKEGT